MLSTEASRYLKTYLPIILFFIGYLFLGLLIYDDFGVHWDEGINIGHGASNILYLKKIYYSRDVTIYEPYFDSIHSREHGAFFEIIFHFLVRSIGRISVYRDVILLHHLYTFLLFYISGIFIARLAYALTKDVWLTMVSSIVYLFHPCIFSHSFFNTTDIGLLSAVTVSTYFLLDFLKEPTQRNASIFAFATAIALNVRLAALVIPLTVMIYYILFLSFQKLKKKDTTSRDLIETMRVGVISYLIRLTFFTYLIWPSLWFNPLNFFESFNETVNQVIDGIPWYYNIQWFLFTTPEVITIIFLIGVFYGLLSIAKNPDLRSDLQRTYIVSMLILIISLILPIVYSVNLYNGWRHHFFLYSSVTMICIIGLSGLNSLIKKRKVSSGFYIFLIFLILYLQPIQSIIKLHPNQHIYINELFGGEIDSLIFTGVMPVPEDAPINLDYWRLSFKTTLDHLLNNTTGDINVFFGSEGAYNLDILNQTARERIHTVSKPKAEYLITITYDPDLEEIARKAYFLDYKGVRIVTAYDLR